MANCLYYVPGNSETMSAHRLNEAGLGSLVVADRMECRGVMRGGPDGGAGMLIACKPEHPSGDLPDLACDLTRQKWMAGPNGDYWLGYEVDRRPRPEDLARGEMMPGHSVELGDGQSWLIPVGRTLAGHSALPQALTIDGAGKWVKEPLPEFVELFETAARLQTMFSSGYGAADGVSTPLSEEEGYDMACRILGLNYRVGRCEVALLSPLLTTSNFIRILEAFIDLPTFVQIGRALLETEKKNGPASIPRG